MRFETMQFMFKAVMAVAIGLIVVTKLQAQVPQYRAGSGVTYSGSYSSLSPTERAAVVRQQMDERSARYGARQNVSQQAAPAEGVVRNTLYTKEITQEAPTRQDPPQASPRASSNLGVLSPGPVGPRTAPSDSIEKRAGKVSAKLSESSDVLNKRVAELRESLLALIAMHEKAPQIDSYREDERMRLFRRLLEDVIALGGIATGNYDELVADVEEFQRLNAKAGPIFRKTEEHFHKLAMNETSKQAKSLYQKAELWYAARAARCEVQAKSAVPGEVDAEIANVQKTVDSCKELLKFVVEDPKFLKDPDSRNNALLAFASGFTSVEQVLDQWTKKLIEDLAPEKSQAK